MALPPPICNKKVTNSRYSSVLAASLAAFLWVAPLPVSATALQFTLDTSSLSGTVAQLAFDFIDGDGVVNNTVVVSDFYTTGTLGNSSFSGGVTVTNPGPFPVTLTDTVFFNEFLQEITLGNSVSFTLNLTHQWDSSGSFPDSFAFFLLDSTATLPLFNTTDLLGGALFAVDIDGTPGGTRFHLFAYADTGEPVTWTLEPVVSVPLPSTALLIGAGLLGGLAARRRVQIAS